MDRTTQLSAADLAQRFLHALETRNIENVMPLWAEDGILEFPFAPEGSSNQFMGKQAIQTILASSFQSRTRIAFPKIDVYSLADPDGAVVEFRGAMELATGKPYNNRYIALVQSHNGQLTLFRESFNPLVDLAAGNPRASEESQSNSART